MCGEGGGGFWDAPVACCPDHRLALCDSVQESEAHHWLNELHSIVLGRIVRGCDHDSNPFSLECPGSKSSDETNAGQDRVENLAMTVSQVLEDILCDR
jgi:hypothetical protein